MYATYPKFQFQDAGPTCLLLRCEGGLSWEDRDLLANEVDRYLQPRPAVRDLVVDMTTVQYVNSAGLGALFQLYRRVRQRGGRLTFANVPAVVARVFNAVGLDRLTEQAADVRGALKRMTGASAPAAACSGFTPAPQTGESTAPPAEDTDVGFTGT